MQHSQLRSHSELSHTWRGRYGAAHKSIFHLTLGPLFLPLTLTNQGFALFSGFLHKASLCPWRPRPRESSLGTVPRHGFFCSHLLSWPRLMMSWQHQYFTPNRKLLLSSFRSSSTRGREGGGAVRKNLAHYYPHYLFLTQHSKVCKGKKYNSLRISILQYLLQTRDSAC